MSDVKIKLSESGMDTPLFHDYEYHYPERNRGANGDYLTITINNKSGNFLSVAVWDEGDRQVLASNQSVSKLVIQIDGAIEHTDFFNMLDLIGKAHQVNNALGGNDVP